MIKYNSNDDKSALDARLNAQKIAFGPIVFQVVHSLPELGILETLQARHKRRLNRLFTHCWNWVF
jgi:hypothetical protein